MGTQQVLLIVLSVIIIGVAVAVGITMFSTQSVSSNRNAIKADLIAFAAQAIAFYKTPAGMAGGGNGNPGFGTSTANARITVGRWMGFGQDGKFENDNGFYFITALFNKDWIRISAWGNEKGQNPSYSNWTCPPGRTGNIYFELYIYPQQNPPFLISTYN